MTPTNDNLNSDMHCAVCHCSKLYEVRYIKVKRSRYRTGVCRGITVFSSMTAALEGGKLSTARPGHTYPQGRPGTLCTVSLVDLTAGLDGRKITFPPELDPRHVQPKPTELPGPRSEVRCDIK